jgi:hypothetical protein
MNCLTAPRSFDDFISVINTCVTSAGGPNWMTLALYGALLVAVVLAAVAGIVVMARR